MDCENFRQLFSDYYDGVLDEETARLFAAHLESCGVCREDYNGFKNLLLEVKNLPSPEVPANLHNKIMRAVNSAKMAARPAERNRKNVLKPFLYAGGGMAACFILVSLIVTGIVGISRAARPQVSAQGQSMADVAATDATGGIEATDTKDNGEAEVAGAIATTESAPAPMLKAMADDAVAFDANESSAQVYDMAASSAGFGAFTDTAPAPSTATADTSELLAAGYYSQTFNISIEVDDLTAAAQAVEALGGYSVSANADFGAEGDGSGWYYRRINVASYTSAKNTLRGLGKVQSVYENTEKLADQIYDMEARLKAKEDECARLLTLLSQSKTMDVMVAVENRYAVANAEREGYNGQLNRLYNQAQYPYLDITLIQYPPKPAILPEITFAQRLNETFVHAINRFIAFMENAAVFFAGSALPLVIVCVIALIIGVALKRRKSLKNTTLLLLFAVASALLSGCGSSADNAESIAFTPVPQVNTAAEENDYAYDGSFMAGGAMPAAEPADMPAAEAAPMPMPTSNPMDAGGIAPPADAGLPPADLPSEAGEKIIQTGKVYLITDAFDQTVDSVQVYALSAGGFIERSEVSGMPLRVCNITLRVPTDLFDTVMKQVEACGIVESSSRNAEDVTAQYYDLAGRLETKQIEEERVLDMLSRAEKIEDVLALETRLGEIRTQIELYQSQMINIDRLSAYSTIRATITEVKTEEMIVVSDDLGGRLKSALIHSVNSTVVFFQDTLLFVAGIFIELIFVALLAVVGWVIYKRVKRGKDN